MKTNMSLLVLGLLFGGIVFAVPTGETRTQRESPQEWGRQDGVSLNPAIRLEIARGQGYVRQMITLATAEGGVDNEPEIDAMKQRIESLDIKSRFGQRDRRIAREANDRGLGYLENWQVAEAVEAFQAAHQADPADVEIVDNLGYAYLRQGEVSVAEQMLLQALAFTPDRSSAWASLGRVYAKQGSHNKAVACFANAYRFSRDYAITKQFLHKLANVNDGKVRAAADRTLQLKMIQADPDETETDISRERLAFAGEGALLTGNQAAKGGQITGYVAHGLKGNTPIAGAVVEYKANSPGSVASSTTTNGGGIYETPYLRPGNYTLTVTKPGFREAIFREVQVRQGKRTWENANLIPRTTADDQNYRVTLSWCNAKPGAVRDVDSYLQIPGSSDPLGYPHKANTYEGTHLDVDDTDWQGPETSTIKKQREGTYIFYVNNYNVREDKRALGKSKVKIQLYRGNAHIKTYYIRGGRGITYEVFRITNRRVQDIERYNDSLKVYGGGR